MGHYEIGGVGFPGGGEVVGDINASASGTINVASGLFGNGTETHPSIGWASDNDGTGTGFYRPNANKIAVTIDGDGQFLFDNDVFYFVGSGKKIAQTSIGNNNFLKFDGSAAISTYLYGYNSTRIYAGKGCSLQLQTTAAGNVDINGSSDGLGDGRLRTAEITRGILASDIATSNMLITAQDAYPEASSNKTGSNVVIAGGLGSKLLTVVDYTQGSGITVTVSVNGSDTVLTEGVHFNAVTSDDITASGIATAITGVTGVTAVDTAAVVNFTPDTTTYELSLATSDASAWTVTNNADGSIIIPDGAIDNPAIAFASAPNMGFYSRSAEILTIAVEGQNVVDISETYGILLGSPTARKLGEQSWRNNNFIQFFGSATPSTVIGGYRGVRIQTAAGQGGVIELKSGSHEVHVNATYDGGGDGVIRAASGIFNNITLQNAPTPSGAGIIPLANVPNGVTSQVDWLQVEVSGVIRYIPLWT